MNTTYIIDNNYEIDGSSHLNPFELKNLVQEMNDAVAKGICLENIPKLRFSPENKGKYDPFGYDNIKDTKLEIPKTLCMRNRILHKLIRIQKEFQFVDRNIEYYQELTYREKEIIQLLARGNNNPKIAEKLFISRCTVEQHRKHINHKLKLHSLVYLLRYAYAFDLI